MDYLDLINQSIIKTRTQKLLNFNNLTVPYDKYYYVDDLSHKMSKHLIHSTICQGLFSQYTKKDFLFRAECKITLSEETGEDKRIEIIQHFRNLVTSYNYDFCSFSYITVHFVNPEQCVVQYLFIINNFRGGVDSFKCSVANDFGPEGCVCHIKRVELRPYCYSYSYSYQWKHLENWDQIVCYYTEMNRHVHSLYQIYFECRPHPNSYLHPVIPNAYPFTNSHIPFGMGRAVANLWCEFDKYVDLKEKWFWPVVSFGSEVKPNENPWPVLRSNSPTYEYDARMLLHFMNVFCFSYSIYYCTDQKQLVVHENLFSEVEKRSEGTYRKFSLNLTVQIVLMIKKQGGNVRFFIDNCDLFYLGCQDVIDPAYWWRSDPQLLWWLFRQSLEEACQKVTKYPWLYLPTRDQITASRNSCDTYK